MWHVVPCTWNGDVAAQMYEHHLQPALVRAWGKRKQYTIIEDGDRKGNASAKGIAAKARAKIYATTLPPRTPSLMPLDYSIWQAIVEKLLDVAPDGVETKDAFLDRLQTTARSLPKGFIKKSIERMHSNIKALNDAKGFTPKND